MVGGNTLISGAEMAAPGNWLQEKEGIEDSVDLFYEDIMKGGDNIADPKSSGFWLKMPLSAAEWLRDDVHVQFEDNMLFFGGHSVKRSLVPLNASGVEPIQKLKAKCDELGIEIQTDTPATKLIQDEAGKVIGVEAQHDGQTLTYTAHNGVIIATGGFGSNLEMRKQYNPMMDEKSCPPTALDRPATASRWRKRSARSWSTWNGSRLIRPAMRKPDAYCMSATSVWTAVRS